MVRTSMEKFQDDEMCIQMKRGAREPFQFGRGECQTVCKRGGRVYEV